jgi:hypothetical protein
MEVSRILVIVVILVLLYIIVKLLYKQSTNLTGITPGTSPIQISASTLAKSGNPNASNFSYSIWFYINDWNYRYGHPKVLFGRMGGGSTSNANGISGSEPCPLVTLGAIQNNLNVSLTLFNNTVHECNVSNVPIQRWVNLIISTYGRSLDVYLDGKLVNTCVLDDVPKINKDADVFITPLQGFSGWTSKFSYTPNATDPQTAWNTYKAGYGESWLSQIFSNRIKISLVRDGEVTKSVTL